MSFATAAIVPLALLTACGKPVLPATQSHLGPGTSTRPTVGKAPLPPATTTTGPPTAAAPWPEHTLAPVPGLLAVDPAGNDAYALVSETTTPEQGPYRLQRTDLVDHSVQDGPLFTQAGLAILAGELWVFGAVDTGSGGPSTQAQGYEVDPGTLSIVRTIALPPATPAEGIMALTAGPEGSVWVGYSHTLLRVDAATGADLDEITAPPDLVVSDVAVDPAGQFLYVSYTHNPGSPSVGAPGGVVVYEYDAASGQALVTTEGRSVVDSIAGASLVAVPGGGVGFLPCRHVRSHPSVTTERSCGNRRVHQRRFDRQCLRLDDGRIGCLWGRDVVLGSGRGAGGLYRPANR